MRISDFVNKSIIYEFFKEYFTIPHRRSEEPEIIQSVKNSAEFKGATLWVLIFAIFVASLGLNVNSTAVIIGAMLISPLMGPIIGMGLALGIHDFELLKRSFKNFGVATVFSILTATLYFLITPLDTAQSEILARTSPTFYDVCIAFFGGLAGVVALGTKDRGNVIPGVAIATALMPPLCTAGFGIATGNWAYAAGALYLFFINTVFISLATFAGVRFMHFKKHRFVDERRKKQVTRYITTVIVVTMCPAIYLTYGIVKETMYERAANHFIAAELNFPNSLIVNKNINYKDKKIDIVLMGAKIPNESIEITKSQMANYGSLEGTRLNIVQNSNDGYENVDELRSLVLEDFYKNSEEKLKEQHERIIKLEKKLERYLHIEQLGKEVTEELMILHPQTTSLTLSQAICVRTDSLQGDTTVVALMHSTVMPDSAMKEQLNRWMKSRTKAKNIELIIHIEESSATQQ